MRDPSASSRKESSEKSRSNETFFLRNSGTFILFLSDSVALISCLIVITLLPGVILSELTEARSFSETHEAPRTAAAALLAAGGGLASIQKELAIDPMRVANQFGISGYSKQFHHSVFMKGDRPGGYFKHICGFLHQFTFGK